MRVIPKTIDDKLKQKIQTKLNNSDLQNAITIERPTIPVKGSDFIETQDISLEGCTCAGIAVEHSKQKTDGDIWLSVVKDGQVIIYRATQKIDIYAHEWINQQLNEPGISASVCFDGTYVNVTDDHRELITDKTPWLFWVGQNGSILAQYGMDESSRVTLLDSGASFVTSVRSTWSPIEKFDFGLIVFYIINGVIYYRQLNEGVWYDPIVVTFGPEGVLWEYVTANHTWDYRIVLNCKSTDGRVFELYSQFQGFGANTYEHAVKLVNINANYTLTKIETIDVSPTTDAINIVNISTGDIRYMLKYDKTAIPVSARNIDDGTGDWGKIIVIEMSHYLTDVENNFLAFTATDSNGVGYGCEVSIIDYKTLTLNMSNFNLAQNATLTVSYRKGTVMSPLVELENFDITFTPINLVKPDIPLPEIVEVYNL